MMNSLTNVVGALSLSLSLLTSPANCLNTGSQSKQIASLINNNEPCIHKVCDMECVEIQIPIHRVGAVTILEATADSQEYLVNKALQEEQSTLKAGDPYGAVLWPAASAVANRLLESPLQGTTVLELGAGTGLVSIAASMGGAAKVLATDYEHVPLQLLKHAADSLNPECGPIETGFLDMCDFNTPLPKADVVVAADVMYEPKTGHAVAQRVVEALRQNCRVLVGDSPGRAGRPAFLKALKELGVRSPCFQNALGSACCGHRHELICGKESESVSDTPQALDVAIMDIDPNTCFEKTPV